MRCLIVTQNRKTGETLSNEVTELGHAATHVATTAEAMALIRLRQFDLVMLDRDLSQARADELMQMCRHALPEAQVISISGDATTGLCTAALRLLAGPCAQTGAPRPGIFSGAFLRLS